VSSRKSCTAVALFSGVALLAGTLTHVAAEVLNRSPAHLRSGAKPEWDEFANKTPDGSGLTLRFNAQSNSTEAALFIVQDNVKLDWPVEVNGKKIGTLFLMEAPLVYTLAVPVGALRDGENTLFIRPPKDNDDIRIGPVTLESRPVKTVLADATLEVRVKDVAKKIGLPCRITVVDASGNLAAVQGQPGSKLAVRPGVVYTADGAASLGLRPGDYTVYATRGFEFGLATARVTVGQGESRTVRLELDREVDTRGWACSDTHIHTGQYARHGDATADERAITLAGEGIELPVSTEHDCLIDLTPAAVRMGVEKWMTPVLGDEVTTAKGHFNIFPVDSTAAVPDKKVTDWPRLMDLLRATPGVRVVILNHPRNIHNEFQPFAVTNFNGVTGENLRGFEFTFDAIEVANSSALQSDWMISFYDWFALLNYGYRFTAVGSSDGHDVSRYIVGQGRTYMRCDDTEPSRLDVTQACRSLKEGRALVSLGLWTDMTVNERFHVGDLATVEGAQVHVEVAVQAPSWSTADRVQLFANGVRIRDSQISRSDEPQTGGKEMRPFRARVAWDIPRPANDAHLIALATGPGIDAPCWALARPYQPSSPVWKPRVFGITNPIWVDADADGKFTPARGYAQRLVQEHRGSARGLISALSRYDEAIAAQVASLSGGSEWNRTELETAVHDAPEQVRRGFETFEAARRASR
jgi:hypothetical protein